MKKTNTLFSILIGISLTACTSSEVKKQETETSGLEVEAPKPTPKKGYAIGDLATDFSLKNIDETMVSLADYTEAKGFIVIFTCNHCPFSVAYEDRIIALDKKYKGLGFPVIAINPNDPEADGAKGDDFESMKVRAKEKGFTFPYLMDVGQEIYPQYGATKTPHTFVLLRTEDGNLVKYIGAIDDNKDDASEAKEKYIEMAVDALLAGEEVKVNQVPAIGCSIKTK